MFKDLRGQKKILEYKLFLSQAEQLGDDEVFSRITSQMISLVENKRSRRRRGRRGRRGRTVPYG